MRVLHVSTAGAWAAAGRAGRHPAGGLEAGTFLHACTGSQLDGVLARVPPGDGAEDGSGGGPGSGGRPVLLVFDLGVCEAAGARVEWASAERAEGPYPHVHGAVPVAAVVAALDLARGEDGAWCAPAASSLDDLGVLARPPRAPGRAGA